MKLNYWLLKSEPSTWSWEDQVKAGVEMWDGVRNYQARNNLKNIIQILQIKLVGLSLRM